MHCGCIPDASIAWRWGEALIGTENMRGYADSIMNKPLSPELMSDV